ncbi:ABC transporter ATP-binding protein [Cohnella terricola]|uniref:ABC transporter ATP-binding protein n=1 Tax=Cohnella terricola TaxID=1289167 RepID=A0A559JWM9_9BACL|nr:ABC transporter ATP-binding protein [Cohnella terricola]TVY04237.1 ABC transporter ATP-binding protein [Cohnella terricola]
MNPPILEVSRLRIDFSANQRPLSVIDDLDLTIREGELVGIVGESGSGKSITSLAVMGLVPSPPGKIESGEIRFKGEDLTKATPKRMRQLRGNEMSMIFQEPMTSLNPVFTIGDQIGESIRIHARVGKKEAKRLAVEALNRVGIPRAEEVIREYPHQLSGGMRQRVMIAIATVCNPSLLIADEPTTALDVTIQAQILDLLRSLNREAGTAIMLITHDLGVVAELCDKVIVMYAGQVVEEGDVRSILMHPKHPYTAALLESVPGRDADRERLISIPGSMPAPGTVTQGCRFASRCSYATGKCRERVPPLFEVGNDHVSRCWLNEAK